MIIVRLKGGLGNQLFQYAFGRRVALLNKTDLYLDIENGFKGDFYKRNYMLNLFNIQEKIPVQYYRNKIKLLNINIKLFEKLKIKYPLSKDFYVFEKTNKYDATLIKTYMTDVYFDGYWQSEKYFKDIEEIIKKEFTLKLPIRQEIKPVIDEINNCNSVSIHYRNLLGISLNGEKNDVAVKLHGKMNENYYSEALRYIRDKEKDIKLFIFSDDHALNLNTISNDLQIKHIANTKDYEDFYLMSLCKHNIIANSSFSWWAAWLNNYPHKNVVAPKQWFNDTNIDASDLIPQTWKRV